MALVQRRNAFNSALTKLSAYSRPIFKAARFAHRAYRKSSQNRNRKREIDVPPTTGEHDVRRVYRKRRMPRRKRRQWKSFTKRVNAVLAKNLGLRVANIIYGGHMYAPVNSSTVHYEGIHSFNGQPPTTGTTGASTGLGALNHWLKILARENSTSTTPAVTNKFICQSVAMDIILSNKSETTTAILECYYITSRRDMPSLPTSGDGVEERYNSGFTDLALIGGGTPITSSTLGTTPFNAPDFAHEWKVYKKTRIQLPPKGVTSIQIRDPKNRLIRADDVELFATRRGITRGILFQMYGVPDGTNVTSTASVSISSTCIYNYYELESNDNAGVLIT